ncbi:hypothetical protein VRK_26050 [Vibrio sp. MEBiC08052]|nr:hypothetical protein VRK_26050 [Vibrio sp. MEBiC08052]
MFIYITVFRYLLSGIIFKYISIFIKIMIGVSSFIPLTIKDKIINFIFPNVSRFSSQRYNIPFMILSEK